MWSNDPSSIVYTIYFFPLAYFIATSINFILQMRRRIEWTTSTITDHVSSNINIMTSYVVVNQPKLNSVEVSSCYRKAVEAFDEYCFQLDDVSITSLKYKSSYNYLNKKLFRVRQIPKYFLLV